MITVDKTKGVITFVPDEELDHSPVIVVNIGLAGYPAVLLDNQMFLNSADTLLTHMYTTLDLWIDENTEAIRRIEESRGEVYEVTLDEILKDTIEEGFQKPGVSEVNNLIHRTSR